MGLSALPWRLRRKHFALIKSRTASPLADYFGFLAAPDGGAISTSDKFVRVPLLHSSRMRRMVPRWEAYALIITVFAAKVKNLHDRIV